MIVTDEYERETEEIAPCLVCMDPIDHCSGHGELAAAVNSFWDDADDEVTNFVWAIQEEGLAFWRCDPGVEGTYGLVLTGMPMRALVVLYAQDLEHIDWETTRELDELMKQRAEG